MTSFRADTEALRRAIDAGVVYPDLPVIAWWKGLDDNLVSALSRQLSAQARPHAWMGKQATRELPASRRYQVSRAPSATPITQSVPTSPWLVELARWPVRIGSFGLVKGLEQYLSRPELAVQTVYTRSQYWGDPWPLGFGQAYEWHFRLSAIDTLGAPWLELTGPQAIIDRIPGQPYDDLPAVNGLWYAAGSCAAANVHLPVPGGQVLRVFLLAGAQAADAPLSAFCRLAGSTQQETTAEAQHVARVTW